MSLGGKVGPVRQERKKSSKAGRSSSAAVKVDTSAKALGIKSGSRKRRSRRGRGGAKIGSKQWKKQIASATGGPSRGKEIGKKIGRGFASLLSEMLNRSADGDSSTDRAKRAGARILAAVGASGSGQGLESFTGAIPPAVGVSTQPKGKKKKKAQGQGQGQKDHPKQGPMPDEVGYEADEEV